LSSGDDEKKRPSSASVNASSSSLSPRASSASSKSSVAAPVVDDSNDEGVSTITMMGFTVEEARQALKQKKNNVESAVFWLLERKKEKQECNFPQPPFTSMDLFVIFVCMSDN
jgi:20S proteasome alpha/beta subunit